MKLCVAQTRSFPGQIEQNIAHHCLFIDRAISLAAEMIIFPELSLTGYEPTLAHTLALRPDDHRLALFQARANAGSITIGVGLPTRGQPAPGISLLIFSPHLPRTVYSKQYLHPDEQPFFSPGPRVPGLIGDSMQVALAICYELSVPDHAAAASDNGAAVYIASVAKYAKGITMTHQRLAEIARCYSLTVLMANSIGLADVGICTGQSAVWNRKGERLGQLDDKVEGMLIFDTVTQKMSEDLLVQD